MRTTTILRIAVTTIGLATWAGTLQAQRYRGERSLDTTFAVRGSARLTVYNFSGDVMVRRGGSGQVRVHAELEDRRTDVEIGERAGRVQVRTTGRRGTQDVSYEITVPEGTAVEVGGISTDIRLEGVCGEVSVNTISGDVNVACTTGLAQIQSTSGDVEVRDVRGELEVSSTSGDVMVREARGNVNAHSVSGEVDLAGVAGTDVTAESVSGEITYSGAIRDNGRYRFRSHSGEVTVRVDGTFNASVDVSTFSGSFDSDFQVQLEPGTQVARNWRFRVGNGSARVQLESFSGSINLERAGRRPREE